MKKTKKNLILLLCALLLTGIRPSTAYAAEGDEAQEDKLLAPYFVIQSEGADISTDYFPLKSN